MDTLERLAPALNRQNEALLTAIAAFFTGITDVYMEMGLLAGAELMKNLEKAVWKLKGQRKPGAEALRK